MSDVTLSWAEDYVLDAFHVTGFFDKRPRPDVSRHYSMVAGQLLHNSPCPGIRLEELADAFLGLERHGYLRLDPSRQAAFLTERGFAVISQPGFKERLHGEVPSDARISRQKEAEGKLAVIMAAATGVNSQ